MRPGTRRPSEPSLCTGAKAARRPRPTSRSANLLAQARAQLGHREFPWVPRTLIETLWAPECRSVATPRETCAPPTQIANRAATRAPWKWERAERSALLSVGGGAVSGGTARLGVPAICLLGRGPANGPAVKPYPLLLAPARAPLRTTAEAHRPGTTAP